ncbi:hypothetical protein JTE90_015966 [Oedothorax gibbosus]|uniref:Uncharacterized protein n=1 Tax=Oedothorax gibbosus TaxID=931172 RepID=A0AAV6VR59_9ARAC|nr:hypothetical protein JTE90_015966 [Oedothorax gibbosus]
MLLVSRSIDGLQDTEVRSRNVTISHELFPIPATPERVLEATEALMARELIPALFQEHSCSTLGRGKMG